LHDRLREHEGDADTEGGPEAEGEDDGFGGEEVGWADEGFGHDGFEGCGVFLGEVGGLVREDYVWSDFGEEEVYDGEEGGIEYYLGDEDPVGNQYEWGKSGGECECTIAMKCVGR
jgi:hypothetical protein